jgi:signal transduction histidine kinase
MASALAAQREAQMAFLGGVAHDLRSPLAALAMSVTLLRPGRPLPDERRLRQTIARVERQTARMKRMVDDFLDLANIEAGRLEIKLGEHDGRGIVRNAVELFEETTSGDRLRVSLPEYEVPLCCDPLRIEQVLTNLISNAIKYSPAGTPVEVALEATDDHVVLRVTDRGMGISDADQRRLFEPFRRVGLSQESVPGVGLGLFVVKRIVDAHGGRIEVVSAPGRGCAFRVHLRGSRRALTAVPHSH